LGGAGTMSIPVIREPARRRFALGEWSAELRGDEIASLAVKGVRILRAVRFVVRDQDWRTIPVRAVATEVGPDSISIDLRFQGWGVDYEARLQLAVPEPDQLVITVHGRALSALRRNRIGLVVLHHPDDAGAAACAISPAGARTIGAFPCGVSPHQPFSDFTTFQWTRRGIDVALDFAGDVFEMEDQRNWSDASFKTYSTPLALPFPVAVAAGDEVAQSLAITAIGVGVGVAVSSPPIELVPTSSSIATLGTSIGAGDRPADIAGWPLGFVLAELDVDDPMSTVVLRTAVDAAASGCGLLDLRLIGDAEYPREADSAVRALLASVPANMLGRVALFDRRSHVTEPALMDVLRSCVEGRQKTTILAGARSHFTELNRNAWRLSFAGCAAVFAMTPQMHAYEIAHIVDTIGVQPLLVEQAHELSHGAEVHVGPVTLEQRFNAVATRATSDGDHVIEHDDIYAHPMVIPWVFAAVVGLSAAGAKSISLLRASGPRGLVLDDSWTFAGSVIRELAAKSGESLRAIGRDAETVAAVIGDSLWVADLGGAGGPRRLILDGVERVIDLAPWQLLTVALTHQ
jgi:hypothetical protein